MADAVVVEPVFPVKFPAKEQERSPTNTTPCLMSRRLNLQAKQKNNKKSYLTRDVAVPSS